MKKVYQIVERKRCMHFLPPGELVVLRGKREDEDLSLLEVESVGGEKVGLWQTIEYEDIIEYKEGK